MIKRPIVLKTYKCSIYSLVRLNEKPVNDFVRKYIFTFFHIDIKSILYPIDKLSKGAIFSNDMNKST